jgi:hypothetical protein
MGHIFSIDNSTKDVIAQALDDILANTADGGLGKTCLLVYPPRLVPCGNCVPDPFSGTSSSRPRAGAPNKFLPGQTCPMCGGKGNIEQEVSEQLTLKCNWDIRSFIKLIKNLDLRVPYSILETKGFMTDLPKVLKANYIVVNLPIAPFIRQRFKMIGEPGDPSNIIQGRYFVAIWERFNG